MEDRIFEMAVSLGRVDEADWEILRALCGQAAAELAGRLRAGIAAEDCAGPFALAGAWLALAGLCAGDDGPERFTAGDLTIQSRSQAARQDALRLQAEQVMRPYLRDDGFVFRGVWGG